MAGRVDTRELKDFAKKLERFNREQRDEFFTACAKELAARLLRKVVKRTAVRSGTLRRGWTGGTKSNAAAYADSLNVQRSGNVYTVEISNPTKYALT